MVQWVPLINPNKQAFTMLKSSLPALFFRWKSFRPSWVGKPKRAAEIGEPIECWCKNLLEKVMNIYIYTHIHISTDWCLIPLMWENFANGIMSIQMSHYSHEKVTPWHCTISSINSRDSKFSRNESPAANWPFLQKICRKKLFKQPFFPLTSSPFRFQSGKTHLPPQSLDFEQSSSASVAPTHQVSEWLQLGGADYNNKVGPYYLQMQPLQLIKTHL